MKRAAIVLLSGGLDSAVSLYVARRQGYACRCLFFDYGQKQSAERRSAERIARAAGASLTKVRIPLPWKGSSLLDRRMAVPVGRSMRAIQKGVPSTYVPGRNIIFLSMAVSYAEATGAEAIFIGAHVQDASGYPDCRSAFLRAFDTAIRTGTKAGLAEKLRLRAPLIRKDKSQIIRMGASLGVPLGLTRSCYRAGRRPCGRCDACVLRAKGFREAGLEDPAYA